jgi:hypothetical protein
MRHGSKPELVRSFVSAKFLMAAPPGDADSVIPEGFPITVCPTVVARGATRSRSHAIKRNIGMATRQNTVRGWAARGW